MNLGESIANQIETVYEDYNKLKTLVDVGYFLINYVVSGGVVTKDVTQNNYINITDIVAALDNDVTRREATSFKTKIANSAYYLDYQAGDFTFGTSHPTGSYLPIAQVTTDANKNVQAITDMRGDTGGFRLTDEYMYPEITALQADNASQKINVKYPPAPLVAAKGDGMANDTAAILAAMAYASQNKLELYFPTGSYGISATLTRTADINSALAYEPIIWRGSGPNNVRFVGLSGFSGYAIDFRKSRFVSVKNFVSNLYIALLNFGSDQALYNAKRQVFAESVFCDAPSGEPINWNMLIVTPKPSSYADNGDGAYSRYPLEIHNYGGYNGIMVVNRSVDDSGNLINGSPDNSAIGITDQVQGVSSAAFLIEMLGNRSFQQLKNSAAASQSSERLNVVYEIDQLGHIAIGCSTASTDPVALGAAGLKLRMSYPSIKLYDQNRSNHRGTLALADDWLVLNVTNVAGTKDYGLQVNYLTGEIQFTGTVGSPLTTITNNNSVHTVSVTELKRITFNNASAGAYVDLFTNGINGQIIELSTLNGNTTIKNSPGNGVYTNTGADVLLAVNRVYTFQKWEQGWLQK